MKVTSSDIVISAVKPEQYPQYSNTGICLGRPFQRWEVQFHQQNDQSKKTWRAHPLNRVRRRP
ncbi:hypothetical protein RCO48_26270 [Peribacillus frigoritolerans]|nr:hypothetical protein [Peribacillus frigoritolerans]